MGRQQRRKNKSGKITIESDNICCRRFFYFIFALWIILTCYLHRENVCSDLLNFLLIYLVENVACCKNS